MDLRTSQLGISLKIFMFTWHHNLPTQSLQKYLEGDLKGQWRYIFPTKTSILLVPFRTIMKKKGRTSFFQMPNIQVGTNFENNEILRMHMIFTRKK